MSRTRLHGLLHVDEHRIAEVRELPFIGLCFADDEGNVTMRPQSLDDIGVAASQYDAHHRVWTFELDLHDDDLPNADTRLTRAFLKRLPLLHENGMLVARQDWMDTPDWLLLVSKGDVIERHIVGYGEKDPMFVHLDEATTLVQSLDWPLAAQFFRSLTTRA